jgi:peptide-methionine (S)-S-oxide reductase
VEQGYISSLGEAADFSEAVVVHFDPEVVSFKTLLKVHLHTHKSTSSHSFRKKYRSAIYYFDPEDAVTAERVLRELQEKFEENIVTQVLAFKEFQPSRESIQDYYRKNPDAPFCKKYIEPKLEFVRRRLEQE